MKRTVQIKKAFVVSEALTKNDVGCLGVVSVGPKPVLVCGGTGNNILD
jgi:hypothetical protein